MPYLKPYSVHPNSRNVYLKRRALIRCRENRSQQLPAHYKRLINGPSKSDDENRIG